MIRVAIALAATVVVVAGCSSSDKKTSTPTTASTSAPPAAISIGGHVELKGPISTGIDAMTKGAPCIGIKNYPYPSEDFEDIVEGAPIEVRDGSGATVGVGTLGAGRMDPVNPLNSRICAFTYSVDNITPGKGFYTLYFGSHATRPMAEADFKLLGNLDLKSVFYEG